MIPMTIVSGYLGAGKTSLINHLLCGDHSMMFGVLVNDFGDLNIDAALIDNRDGATIALNNGCVCCTIADDMLAGLDRLRAWPTPVDHILIEASGVADPAKVALYAETSADLRLLAVLGLVDAVQIRRQSNDKFIAPLIRAQLRHADLLILNKIDLLAAATVADVRKWLATNTAGQPVLNAQHGAVPIEQMLDPVGPGRPKTVDDGTLPTFESIRVDLSAPLDRSFLERQMAALPQHIYRIKGIVLIDNEPQLLQAVGRRWTLSPWLASEELPRTLIFIGPKGLATSAKSWLQAFASVGNVENPGIVYQTHQARPAKREG